MLGPLKETAHTLLRNLNRHYGTEQKPLIWSRSYLRDKMRNVPLGGRVFLGWWRLRTEENMVVVPTTSLRQVLSLIPANILSEGE